jgi:hypothetical protein
MGQTSIGTQNLTFKYSTPLQADYLNTMLAGFSGTGLFVRPMITAVGAASENGQTFTVHPFSVLIEPSDKILAEKNIDENGKVFTQKVVKISITENVDLTVTPTSCAIGLEYSFSNNMVPQAQWYADIKVLDKQDFDDGWKGIVVATVQHHVVGTSHYFSVTTAGADISDALLIQEGWDPNCWLSVARPNRCVSGGVIRINRLELRCHNDTYKGYMTGRGGIKEFNAANTIYDFKKSEEDSNPDGIRGFMPAKWNAFSLRAGLKIDGSDTGLMPKTWNDLNPPMDCNDTLPISHQSGGVFALVNAENTMEHIASTSFVNKLKIYPVKQEVYNIYYDSNTLYIK